MKLDNLGNFESSENPQRKVMPVGLITTPNLVLKGYDMYIKNPSEGEVIIQMNKFIIQEINKGEIDPKIGLGFAILSKDMLNVVRWDNNYPIVAVNSIYEFPEDQRNVMASKKLDVGDFGAYCIWEFGIVAYEKELWKKYLSSQRREEDKKRYLENFIEGDL